MGRREWDRSESGAVQNGTGKGRRGKWRWPPDWAVRREPLGRVKGIGGRVAGCTRWEREGRTDSRSKTWVAPESARIGEGVIAHRRAGVGGSSPSESYGDSRAAKGLGEAKREWVFMRGKIVWGRGEVVRSWVNASRRTGEGGGLSSVRVEVSGEGANRGSG